MEKKTIKSVVTQKILKAQLSERATAVWEVISLKNEGIKI